VYVTLNLESVPDQPKTPQMTTRIDRQLRAQAVAIARVRKERDDLGFGASVIVRKAIRDYVRRHRDQLPDNWRDYL
jgi:hypothetical protein